MSHNHTITTAQLPAHSHTGGHTHTHAVAHQYGPADIDRVLEFLAEAGVFMSEPAKQALIEAIAAAQPVHAMPVYRSNHDYTNLWVSYSQVFSADKA